MTLTGAALTIVRLLMKRFLASSALIVSLTSPAAAEAASWWDWVPKLFTPEKAEEQPFVQNCRMRNSWGRCVVLDMPGSGGIELPKNAYRAISSYEHLMLTEAAGE